MFAFHFVAFTNAIGTVHAGPSALIVLFRTAFNFDYRCLRRKTGTYCWSFFLLIDRPVFPLSFGLQNCKLFKDGWSGSRAGAVVRALHQYVQILESFRSEKERYERSLDPRRRVRVCLLGHSRIHSWTWLVTREGNSLSAYRRQRDFRELKQKRRRRKRERHLKI